MQVVRLLPLPEGTERESIFYVEARSADLHGAAEFSDAFFDLQHLQDGVLFVEGIGPYSQFTIIVLFVLTKVPMTLEKLMMAD